MPLDALLCNIDKVEALFMVYGSNKLLLISINISQEMVMDDGRIVPTGPQATRVPRQNCTAHRLTLDDVPVVGELQKN